MVSINNIPLPTDSLYKIFITRVIRLLLLYSAWSTCITNVDNSGCTFSDLFRLVYYNTSYDWHRVRAWYNLTTQELLPYLCSTAMQGIIVFLFNHCFWSCTVLSGKKQPVLFTYTTPIKLTSINENFKQNVLGNADSEYPK